MKSILAAGLLFVTLSLCNLADKKSANSNGPDNANQNAGQTREELLVELMKLEGELTTAAMNGDISTLAPNIADDYSGTSADGVVQNKNQLLASIKPEKLIRSWKITDAQLVSSTDDSAVLTYIQSLTLRNGRTYRARITDTFVKRDGRWLVKSEQQTLMK